MIVIAYLAEAVMVLICGSVVALRGILNDAFSSVILGVRFVDSLCFVVQKVTLEAGTQEWCGTVWSIEQRMDNF